MKTLKIFLIGGAVLMLVAVGLGVYVWYQLQGLDRGKGHVGTEAAVEEVATSSDEVSTQRQQEMSSNPADTVAPAGPVVTETTAPENSTEDIIIDERELTPDQIKLLNRLGVDTETIVITGEMVECAEDKLGTVRVDEIVAGATPTVLEGFSVLPCLNE